MKQVFKQKIWSAVKFVVGIALTFGIVYGLLNLPSFLIKAKYDLNQNNQTTTAINQLPNVKDAILNKELPTSQGLIATNQQTSTNTTIPDNYLIIPKLAISAPIHWDVPESQVIAKLQTGVVHYQGSAKPGEIGNVFITGHSSYYYWDRGKYKTVFALLGNLSVGDQISISYHNHFYIYQVYEKVTVKPSQVNVLAQNTNAKILSLMTCTPVGTNWNRLIIKAKQIN